MKPSRIALATLVLYLALSAAYVGYQGWHKIAYGWFGDSDLTVFYDAANVSTSAQRGLLYRDDPYLRVYDGVHLRHPAFGSFFNPPAAAFAYWPLTRLGFLTAQAVVLAGSIAAAVALSLLPLLWGGDRRYVFLTFASLASCWALYMGLWMGQPAVMYALIGGIGLYLLERYGGARAGAWLSLLALKPTLLAGPLLLAAWRRKWTAAVVAAGVGAALVLLPFLAIGASAFGDYRVLTAKLTQNAFHYEDGVTVGAYGLMSWNGYWAWLTGGSPPYAAIIALDAITLLLALRVVASGTLREGWLALTAATLLVTPHSLAYDWVLLVPGLVAVACERPSKAFLALVLALHVALNLSIYQQGFAWYYRSTVHHVPGGYVAVPMLALMLAYLTLRPAIDAAVDRALALARQAGRKRQASGSLRQGPATGDVAR